MSVNILLTKNLHKRDIDYVKHGCSDIRFYGPCLDIEDLRILIRNTEIHMVLGPPPDSDQLEILAGNLRFVQIPWSGVDNIDIEPCKAYDIQIANSRSNSNCVAEMAFSLALSLIKQIPLHDAGLRTGEWHRMNSSCGHFPPRLLGDFTIGYIGFGSVNRACYKLFSPFIKKHYALTRSGKNIEFPGITFITKKDELFKHCDLVVVAVPLTPETDGLVCRKVLKLFGENSYIINVSRGKVIQESDLFSCLEKGEIGGAAIDVWYNYPTAESPNILPSNYPFESLKNVIMSPHRAGYLKSRMPHLDDVKLNIENFKLNKPLRNIIG